MNIGSDLSAADLSALSRNGILPELVARAGIRRVNSSEGASVIGRREGSADYSGLAFPYYWPGSDHPREYRLRLDHPPMEPGKDGRPKPTNKYLGPPGRPNRAYIVPGTEPGWLTDTALPVVLTEGEKKTLALWTLAWHDLGESADRPRWLPVGIAGVWSWRGTVGKETSADGGRVPVKGTIPDFDRVQWRGRKVIILFDTNAQSNVMVQAARWELTRELRRRGAQVHWFDWPGNTPKEVNGVDDLIGLWGLERVSELMGCTKPAPLNLSDLAACERDFAAVDGDRYRLNLPALGIAFEIDRVRRERSELLGELAVTCHLPGARTFEGVLSIADFNLSSARARSERARLLAERAHTRDLDWAGLIEEFCQRVLAAEREGRPAVDLRTLPAPERNSEIIRLDGLALPRKHPSIAFGDGGAAKSYIGLYLMGRLARLGVGVALFDWELGGEDHRERLERIFGADMPRVLYARCERPLVHEADRLRRLVRENSIEYAIFDSVAFACDGPPEAAEVAGRYFRAVRIIGCGSLHIAHVSKSGDDAERKPFGSTFWHNGARSTWFVRASDESQDTGVLEVGLFNRKSNLGPLSPPTGFRITFTEDRTTFNRLEPASNSNLAKQLSVRQRMAFLLRQGAMAPEMVAEEIEADLETVKRTARRYKKTFTVLEGGRLGLLETRAS